MKTNTQLYFLILGSIFMIFLCINLIRCYFSEKPTKVVPIENKVTDMPVKNGFNTIPEEWRGIV